MQRKVVLEIMLTLLLIGMLTLAFNSQAEPDAGWLSDWSYRKSHEIAGTTAGEQADYQIRIKVHRATGTDSGEDVYVGTKCRTDFGDIRFTGSNGTTPLDYWLESYDGEVATFWVEVDSIPASPDSATVYVYYGKSDATTTSNGTDTFIDFDDFEYSDSIENHGWTIEEIASGGSIETVTNPAKIGSRSLRLYDASTSNACKIFRNFPVQTQCLQHIFMRVEQTDAYTIQAWRNADTTFGCAGFRPFSLLQYKVDGKWQTLTTYSASQWCRIETVLNTDTDQYEKIWVDEIEEGSNLQSTYPTANVTTYRTRTCGKMKTGTAYYDAYFIRKYVDPEPSHGSWGPEEPPTIPLSIKLSGEHDYATTEEANIRLAALVRDLNTMEPVSDANVTIEIYDPDGNLWTSDVMVERVVESGIYEWQSNATVYDLIQRHQLEKGVYLAHVQASYQGGPTASDILMFHIDPPTEGSSTVPTYYVIVAVAVLVSVAGLIVLKRPIYRRFRRANQHVSP